MRTCGLFIDHNDVDVMAKLSGHFMTKGFTVQGVTFNNRHMLFVVVPQVLGEASLGTIVNNLVRDGFTAYSIDTDKAVHKYTRDVDSFEGHLVELNGAYSLTTLQ